jgi:hypothetical protein
MSTTKLDLVNRVLDSVGERRILATAGNALALIVEDCIQLALDEVAFAANWSDLRVSAPATSWSTNVATITTAFEINVRSVQTLVSGANPYYVDAQFVTQEEFIRLPMYSYTGSKGTVQLWTHLTSNQISCYPYPSDTPGRNLVIFTYQTIPVIPASDGNAYVAPDRFMRMVELKASSLFALKHVADQKLYAMYAAEYMQQKRRLLPRDNGTPTQGHNMYAGTRRRYR